MNSNKIFYWSITVALAGFLFGFDTVVISGAEQSLQALWDKGETFHGFVIMASALWGTVIGAIFGGIPTDPDDLGNAVEADDWLTSLRGNYEA